MEDEIARDFSEKTWKEDVTLIVEGEQLHVSKSVLAYVSPVFDAMFSRPFSERNKTEIELPGKEYNAFLEFLRCIYPGKRHQITEENIFQIIPLADEYQVKQLLGDCESVLRQYVAAQFRTVSEILKCLAISERYQMKDLKDICVKMLEERQPTEIADAESEQMCRDTMLNVMRKLVIKQQLEHIKAYIKTGKSTPYTESEYDDYKDAKGAVIDFTLEHSCESKRVESPAVILDGFKFFAIVKFNFKRASDNRSMLGIFLAAQPIENKKEWRFKVKARLILKNFRLGDRMKIIEQIYKPSDPNWGYENFVDTSDITDQSKGYIRNGKIQIIIPFLAKKGGIEI